MRIRTSAVAACVLLVLVVPALAESPRYTYGQVGFTEIEPDGGGNSGDGPALRFSFAVQPRIFVFGDFLQTDYDGPEQTTWSAGVGGRLVTLGRADLFAELAYVDTELEAVLPIFGPVSVSEEGYRAGAGVRARVGKRIELNGGINHLDLGDGADDTSLGAGLLVDLTRRLALGLAATHSDNFDSLSLGLRGYFGKR